MSNYYKEEPIPDRAQAGNNVMRVLAGLIIGSMAGALTMLLLVPQSGTNTRAQIQQKSLELHDRMTDAIDDIVTLTHYDNRHIPTGLREKTRYGTAQVREIRNINAK